MNGLRCVMLFVASSAAASGYSVLSHEAIIDSAWKDNIRPILLQRFPNATPDDLRKAHGYAYGGAIIQDLGYYPFGSHLFTDLTHYIRSGDFILNMLASAQDLNEYAFALGSLAHYGSDNIGHSIAVNISVPLIYPKDRRKFGPVATYEDNPGDHLKMEFAFDVSQAAENHYAPEDYHDFIGFEVSEPVLERAFEATYGVPLKEISKNLDLALGTYRWTVSTLLPKMTRAAWSAHKDEIMRANPGAVRKKFVYAISRSSYEKEWGTNYGRPGPGASILAFFIRILPKVGPLKSLAFRPATPETQKLFMDSFVKALDFYKSKLAEVRAKGKPDLPNTNFDTGEAPRAGKYQLADKASDTLLTKLAERHGAPVDEGLREAILNFYGSQTPADAKAAAELTALRSQGAATHLYTKIAVCQLDVYGVLNGLMESLPTVTGQSQQAQGRSVNLSAARSTPESF
ncbi:MAG TPA: zinc dependent phospholipase C family protein [Bryobacteraceae bacterium]|nr:zinc dependent phospholipase C family protein [Bryobacteraceae bacterium]